MTAVRAIRSRSGSRGSIRWMPELATSTTMIVLDGPPFRSGLLTLNAPGHIASGPTTAT